MSVGLLSFAGAHDPEMALRRAAALDACDDRTHRGSRSIRGPRLHADTIGDRLRSFSPFRNALSDPAEGAIERHVSGLSRGRRRAIDVAGAGARRAAGAAVRTVHD